MTKTEKLNAAIKHLRDISAEWDERDVDNYPDRAPSFDELVNALAGIEFAKFLPNDWIQLKASSRVGRVISTSDAGVQIAMLLEAGDETTLGKDRYWVTSDKLCRYDMKNCDEYCCADCGAVFADGGKRDDHFISPQCSKSMAAFC